MLCCIMSAASAQFYNYARNLIASFCVFILTFVGVLLLLLLLLLLPSNKSREREREKIAKEANKRVQSTST